MNWKSQGYSRAYWAGWNGGRCEEQCRFTENHRLAELKAPAERLDYYKGKSRGPRNAPSPRPPSRNILRVLGSARRPPFESMTR
jgi:hypothetical protein